MSLRVLKRVNHSGYDRFTGENVALGRAKLALFITGILRGFGTGISSDFALGIDDGELASLLGPILRPWIRIRVEDSLDNVLW